MPADTEALRERVRVCLRCKDDGFYFLAPEGVNPFLVPLPRLAQVLRRVQCNCRAALSQDDTTKKDPSP